VLGETSPPTQEITCGRVREVYSQSGRSQELSVPDRGAVSEKDVMRRVTDADPSHDAAPARAPEKSFGFAGSLTDPTSGASKCENAGKFGTNPHYRSRGLEIDNVEVQENEKVWEVSFARRGGLSIPWGLVTPG
jgi:hypothetical protein